MLRVFTQENITFMDVLKEIKFLLSKGENINKDGDELRYEPRQNEKENMLFRKCPEINALRNFKTDDLKP